MPDNERDIVVLMSTHNGERFVAAQAESLRTQTLAGRIHLIIRDDGSTDSTMSVLESLDLAPLTVQIISGTNLGPRDSFAAAAEAVPDYARTIMFCDQDDVWLPDKAEVAARFIEDTDENMPALYCGRSTITDSHLTPVGITDDAPRGPSFRNSLFQNIAPGHTMAVNLRLLRLFRQTINPGAIMHDWWLYCLASGLGRVVFDPVPHAYYRLHGHNQIGYQATRLQRAWSGLMRLVSEDRSVLTAQAEALSQAIGSDLNPTDQATLAAFLDQERLGSRWRYLRQYPMIAQTRRTPWVSSLLFLAGRYRKREW